MHHEIEHPEVGKVCYFRNNRAKRIIISVKPEYVRVIIPRRQSFKNAEKFFESKINWVKKRTSEMRSQLAKAKALTRINKKEARRILENRVAQLAKKHDFVYNRISIRKQKTRWGSCSTKNNLSLNMNLLHLPKDLIDYVLVHELVHTKVKNHGNEFWDELDKIVPKSKEKDRKLKDYNYCLF